MLQLWTPWGQRYSYSFSFSVSSRYFVACRVVNAVPHPISQAQVSEAVQRAAQAWLDQHQQNQSAAARAAVERGTPISQQKLSWASRGQKIGEKMAREVAALYDTTPEGLVALFVGGVVFIELRNVPGWQKAKQEAMAARGDKVSPWVWRAIDEVRVPARLRHATPRMVEDIADFLERYGQSSGLRPRVVLDG